MKEAETMQMHQIDLHIGGHHHHEADANQNNPEKREEAKWSWQLSSTQDDDGKCTNQNILKEV